MFVCESAHAGRNVSVYGNEVDEIFPRPSFSFMRVETLIEMRLSMERTSTRTFARPPLFSWPCSFVRVPTPSEMCLSMGITSTTFFQTRRYCL